jgi:hypothetical protein
MQGKFDIMSLNEIKSKVTPILKKNGIIKAGLFGSYSRHEDHEASDIDILVKIGNDISLLDFIGIKIELEDLLGMKVDLVEYDTLKPALKDKILAEEISLY